MPICGLFLIDAISGLGFVASPTLKLSQRAQRYQTGANAWRDNTETQRQTESGSKTRQRQYAREQQQQQQQRRRRRAAASAHGAYKCVCVCVYLRRRATTLLQLRGHCINCQLRTAGAHGELTDHSMDVKRDPFVSSNSSSSISQTPPHTHTLSHTHAQQTRSTGFDSARIVGGCVLIGCHDCSGSFGQRPAMSARRERVSFRVPHFE